MACATSYGVGLKGAAGYANPDDTSTRLKGARAASRGSVARRGFLVVRGQDNIACYKLNTALRSQHLEQPSGVVREDLSHRVLRYVQRENFHHGNVRVDFRRAAAEDDL